MVKTKLKSCKAVTGIDLTIALVIIAVFTGVVSNLIFNVYKQSLNIQYGAYANMYATMIFEKIDEISYDHYILESSDMEKNISDLSVFNAIDLSNFSYKLFVDEESDYKKSIRLKMNYTVCGEEKQITFNRYKIKEIKIES